MAYPITGNYDYTPLNTPKPKDYASVYAAIGNALNQKYYQNRQAYITGIVDPLSKVKATERGKKVLNDVRSTIANEADQFRENDNWFDADNFIFGASEYISNHEGLKAVQEDYALQQAFNEELKNSDWDQQMQTAFQLRSKLNSTEIEYDPVTNTATGGFNPVQIGKKFDVEGFYKDISDILSKAKADGYSNESLLTDPNAIRQYGLDVITGFNGEAIASHFIKQGVSQEGISETEIYNYATQLLKNNPEYRQYLATVWQNNDVLNRFETDDSIQGGHLRDYTFEDYVPIFGNELVTYILNGLGITGDVINLFGSNSDNGTFKLNSNLSAENQAKVNELNANFKNTYDITITDLLTGKAELSNKLQQIGLEAAVDKLYETSAGDGIDKTAWIQNILATRYINDNIENTARSYAGIYGYNKTSHTIDYIANPMYKALAEAMGSGNQELVDQIYGNSPVYAVLSGMAIEGGVATNLADSINDINNQLTQLDKQRDIIFTENEFKTLGVKPEDHNRLLNMTYDEISNVIDNNKSISDDDKSALKAKVLQLQETTHQYNDLLTLRDEQQLNLNKVYDTYNQYKDQIADGIGWYRVNNPTAKFILDNRIQNYNDYFNTLTELGYKLVNGENGAYFTNGSDYVDALSEQKFNRILKNAIENVTERYKKITGNVLTWTGTRQTISNPSQEFQNYINQMLPQWKRGAGDLVITYTSTGKGIGKAGLDVGRLLDLNVFPNTITTNSKGVSIAQRNTIQKETAPIPGKEYGVDFDIYATKLVPVSNGFAARNGKQEYMIELYDKSGTVRDYILVQGSLTPTEISNYAVNDYERSIMRNDPLSQRNRGSIASSMVVSNITFKPNGNSSVGFDVTQVQNKVDQQGKQKVYMELTDPISGLVNGNSRMVEIGKSEYGYYVTDVEGLDVGGALEYGAFNYNNLPDAGYYIENLRANPQNGIPKYYSSVAEALNPVMQYILEQSVRSKKLYEVPVRNQIMQVNNSYRSR